MDKTTKGCLISFIILVFSILSIVFLIIQNINNSFFSDKRKVDTSWENYIKQLHYRDNIILNKYNIDNISVQINKTEKYLKDYRLKKDLLNNEYILNDSLIKYVISPPHINEKLNTSLMIYNSNVREFNIKYSSFPYNYLRIKKSVDLYDYFEIQYGLDNNEIIKKNQKIDDWIKNGGELK